MQLISKHRSLILLGKFRSTPNSNRKLLSSSTGNNTALHQHPNERLFRRFCRFHSTLINKNSTSQLNEHLNDRKQSELSANGNVVPFDRTKFDILVKRRFLFDQSYDLYGGAGGLYDLGPIGCGLKINLIELWRKMFVLEEQMLEIDCPTLTIRDVLKASGHVDRFTDYLVKDVVSEECFRLDHLIKAHLENLCSKSNDGKLKAECTDVLVKLNGKTMEETSQLVQRFDIKSPSGNDLSDAIDFNLMFSTQMGPSNSTKCYLRPETAQGIFVNFKRLLDYNNGRLPFAAAQVGNSFRNEISPRGGLLRVREFTQAEIEYFFDPTVGSHRKFKTVRNTEVILYSACNQMNDQSAHTVTLGEAVEKGTVSSESFGYFLAKIQQFFHRIGIPSSRLRFRQHMANEMAHYSTNCWDAEVLTDYGWTECVGCADRSAFDLTQHAEGSGMNLVATKNLDEPKVVKIDKIVLTDECAKALRPKKVQALRKYLDKLNMEQHDEFWRSLKVNGYIDVPVNEETTIRLDGEAVDVRKEEKIVHVETIVPHVLEQSFGIGRILHVVLENCFRQRTDGDKNSYFALPLSIAPHKCSVLPLSARPEFEPFVESISSHLTRLDISHKIDNVSGSIGRRYVRCDEIGIPFGITVDFDTLQEPHTITVRERDSKSQLRIPIGDVGDVIKNLCSGKTEWSDLENIYPTFVKQQSTG